MISGRYRDIAHHFSAKGFNFGSVFQQVAAPLAHGPAGFESFISMTSGGAHASDEAWAKATRIARELDRVLDGAAPVREAVMRAASELRLSTRQVYNYLARYREERRCRVAVNDETGRFGSPFDPKILPINMSRPSQQYDFNGLSDPVRYSVVSELWATISQLRAKYHI